MGWKAPEPFQGKAADGTTDLYGLIWRPSNFDAAKKYPIVEFVYTGPQSFFVPKTLRHVLACSRWQNWGLSLSWSMGAARLDDPRAFHQFSYRNLGGAFEDHVAMIKQMAARYPYMDVDARGNLSEHQRVAMAQLMPCWRFRSFTKSESPLRATTTRVWIRLGGTNSTRDIRCRTIMLRNPTSPWRVG